jgi:hypothetical protein
MGSPHHGAACLHVDAASALKAFKRHQKQRTSHHHFHDQSHRPAAMIIQGTLCYWVVKAAAQCQSIIPKRARLASGACHAATSANESYLISSGGDTINHIASQHQLDIEHCMVRMDIAHVGKMANVMGFCDEEGAPKS